MPNEVKRTTASPDAVNLMMTLWDKMLELTDEQLKEFLVWLEEVKRI